MLTLLFPFPTNWNRKLVHLLYLFHQHIFFKSYLCFNVIEGNIYKQIKKNYYGKYM